MRILAIEDDPDIGRLVRLFFERDKHDVVHTTTAAEGLRMLRDWRPDLVLLDIGLPDMSGFDVLRRVRETSTVPVLILTARGEEADRVSGLNLGADDYIVKPFSLPELAARVRAVTRRADHQPDPKTRVLTHREFVLDPKERWLRREEEEVALTNTELEILRMLMQKPGRLVTRSAISHAVWGRSAAEAKNLLDVHMSSLRKKLASYDDEHGIETVRGQGFRLSA